MIFFGGGEDQKNKIGRFRINSFFDIAVSGNQSSVDDAFSTNRFLADLSTIQAISRFIE